MDDAFYFFVRMVKHKFVNYVTNKKLYMTPIGTQLQ
jgi:hypothetical protein